MTTDKNTAGGSRPSPAARPTLNRTYIAAAALALIDANGLGKFSMRKLGSGLGVDPMAVYRHFRDQEELFDGVAEALFDELDMKSLPWDSTWRDVTEQYCLRLRDTLLAHPQAVSVFATRPVRSRASIDTGVRLIELLRAAGFSPAHALQIARCLREFTIGHALSLAVVRLGSRSRSRKPSPDSAAYNILARAADDTEIDEHFGIGLTAMLDGFERLA
ncbi:TetR/AcrR family tetracycline transcriptional repressor [Streptomyces aurantiacus]|uniref:TetR/AcrR family transcriptional regulator C-terminal domain-containing protein n=1 Tax=Streptomyces aurantiacus TaxID=47760 RepID=UPI00278F13D8|nr:TetR/AcrR family transcriptional regulator C-terminal domain-containing protein [Streptomyces aurantiacus]MDQ0779107.1 TetR/AcrR family tetracycline transcriptional repressor [Streptomyces aurantiacus]